jgi:hypothetical protein
LSELKQQQHERLDGLLHPIVVIRISQVALDSVEKLLAVTRKKHQEAHHGDIAKQLRKG